MTGEEDAAERAELPPPAPATLAGKSGGNGFESRDPRALGLELTVGGLVLLTIALVALGVATLLFFLVPLPGWIYLPAVALPSVLAFPFLVVPRLRHRRYRYRVDERGLEIRQGVWWRSHRFIPRSRLQHSDLAQGPLERRLGLANLIVHTAGTHEAETKIEGLAVETARTVRDRLTGATDDETDGV